MQLQSKIPVKKTKIIACICLIVLIVVCSVLSNKEISKHKNDSSQNVSDDINIQKKTTIETSELQEKKSDIFVPSTDDKTIDVSSDNNIVSQYAVLVNADDGTITASKNANEKMYIQVTESMKNESVRERELKPLQKIHNNYKKMVITLDKALDDEYDGIQSIDVIEWLLCHLYQMK